MFGDWYQAFSCVEQEDSEPVLMKTSSNRTLLCIPNASPHSPQQFMWTDAAMSSRYHNEAQAARVSKTTRQQRPCINPPAQINCECNICWQLCFRPEQRCWAKAAVRGRLLSFYCGRSRPCTLKRTAPRCCNWQTKEVDMDPGWKSETGRAMWDLPAYTP